MFCSAFLVKYEDADFKVSFDRPDLAALLETEHMVEECGAPGLYTTIPASFVKNKFDMDMIYGNPGNVQVLF